MRRVVPLGIRTVVIALGVGAVTTVVGACSKDNAAIDKGGECAFATDCAPGLVCVPQRNKGTSICTDDLSGVAGEPPDMGEEGDASDEAGEGGEAGGRDGTTDAPIVVPDTGTTDTGSVQDTGTDTSQPPVDAGGDSD